MSNVISENGILEDHLCMPFLRTFFGSNLDGDVSFGASVSEYQHTSVD